MKARRPRHKSEDVIKMDLRETGWEDVDWIHDVQDRDQWQALVNVVMNLWVPILAPNFLTELLFASQERLLLHVVT
jgi:hypothetical protein